MEKGKWNFGVMECWNGDNDTSDISILPYSNTPIPHSLFVRLHRHLDRKGLLTAAVDDTA
jgi:hypothetical protein